MNDPNCQPIRILDGQFVTDGAGVRLRRSLGLPECEDFDPFLLLDEIHSTRREDYIEGFPPHPHRGFQTITMMREGGFRHRDSLGNEGAIGPGGVQWMKAGAGIVHEEMPAPDNGRLWGYQLWFNLPAAHKLDPPQWRDIAADEIPWITDSGSRLRLIAGELDGRQGPLDGAGQGLLLIDAELAAGAECSIPLPDPPCHALVYLACGRIVVGTTPLGTGQLALLRDCPLLRLEAREDSVALIAAAHPIGEPIARGGPFVMNRPEELRQAVLDWQQGRMGRI